MPHTILITTPPTSTWLHGSRTCLPRQSSNHSNAFVAPPLCVMQNYCQSHVAIVLEAPGQGLGTSSPPKARTPKWTPLLQSQRPQSTPICFNKLQYASCHAHHTWRWWGAGRFGSCDRTQLHAPKGTIPADPHSVLHCAVQNAAAHQKCL